MRSIQALTAQAMTVVAAVLLSTLTVAMPAFAQSSNNTWSQGAPMPTARSFLGSATVGKLTYSFGGADSIHPSTLYATNEAYNPASNTWTEKAPMPTMSAASAVAVGSGTKPLIYVIGGCSNSGCTVGATTNEAYNPGTNTWVKRAPKPTGGWGLTAARGSNGLIYVFGGNYFGPSATVEAYNPSTNTWRCSVGDTAPGCTSATIAPIPEPSFAGSAIAVRGTIYLVIGSKTSGAATGDMYAYNVTKNTWTQLTAMPTPRDYAGAALAAGSIYVIGGCNYNGSCGPQSAVESYNLTTHTWTADAALPTAVGGPGAATMANGKIQVVGGGSDGNADGTQTNQIYTP